MGDTIGDDNSREIPAHKVSLDGIAVGLFEATFTQYDKFCVATNCVKPNDEGWVAGRGPSLVFHGTMLLLLLNGSAIKLDNHLACPVRLNGNILPVPEHEFRASTPSLAIQPTPTRRI